MVSAGVMFRLEYDTFREGGARVTDVGARG